jgi:hypothetical protein
MYIHCIVMLQNNKLKWFAVLPLFSLMAVAALGQAGNLQMVKAWNGDGDGVGYWHHWVGGCCDQSNYLQGSYWSQVGSEQSNCGSCGSGDGGEYHSYRYLVGFQDGVQDAQAGNNYDCQIGYHTLYSLSL